jgi:hypothetical protein
MSKAHSVGSRHVFCLVLVAHMVAIGARLEESGALAGVNIGAYLSFAEARPAESLEKITFMYPQGHRGLYPKGQWGKGSHRNLKWISRRVSLYIG